MILVLSIVVFLTILCYNVVKDILTFRRKDKIQNRLSRIQNKLK